MASLRDGLGGEELSPSGVEVSGTNMVYIHPYFLGSITTEDQISGANVYSTAAVHGENVYGDTLVSGADMLGDTYSGTNYVNDVGELQSVAAGSTYGALVQAGSATLSSNEVSILFKTAYAGAPIVTVSNLDNVGSQTVWVGSTISTTGFTAVGTAADDEFGWIAVGI